MPKIDLSRFKPDELKQLQKDVAKAISTFEAKNRKEALAAAKKAAAAAGFSLDELVGTGKPRSVKKPSAAAKYRHPQDPKVTWSGRGRQPAWFKQAVEGGTKKEDMLIA